MRTINSIIVHCTATKALQHFNVNDVRRWHQQRGFSDIGYHYVVLVDGTIENGRSLSEVGAHCKGHNAHSIGVCYVGGLNAKGAPADTRTPAQRKALRQLLTLLKQQFPATTIHGHRDFATKPCPCFNATAEYADISAL
jgi:N-acetylmuramoyl-L-alanine amidase